MLTEHFFYIKHSFKCFSDNISFKPHNNPIREIKWFAQSHIVSDKQGFKSKKSDPRLLNTESDSFMPSNNKCKHYSHSPPTTLFLKNFLLWTIFNVFIEFVTILLLFYVLVFWPEGMWDLSSPTRDQTCTLCLGRPSFNRWTTREVPSTLSLNVTTKIYMICNNSFGNMWNIHYTIQRLICPFFK